MKKIYFLILLMLLGAATACSASVEAPSAENAPPTQPSDLFVLEEPDADSTPVAETSADESYQLTPEGWYDAAGTGVSAEDIEAFARQVRDSVAAGDWASFAKLLYYPITIGDTAYYDSDAFLASDPAHFFSDEWTEAIEAESCHAMFASWRGIMMGNGEIWISGVINGDTAPILVTSINP